MKGRYWIIPSLLLALACQKQNEQAVPVESDATDPEPPAALSTSIGAAAPAPVVDVESLPVVEDFEQEAGRELTAQNLTAKLDELEKEIERE
jgi:hypothetical protein